MENRSTPSFAAVPFAIMLFLMPGCAGKEAAAPPSAPRDVRIYGVPCVRSEGSTVDRLMEKSFEDALKVEDPSSFFTEPDGVKVYSALIVSGGADNGAYGAGVLKGWTKRGTRPVFKAVTGVSTGALIAPYAFAGSDYDKDIERVYTTISTKDILKQRNIVSGLLGNSMASSEPLERLISECATDKLLADIARGHRGGRRLLIGTVNLDAQTLVMWDMGALAGPASRGDARAKKLFNKILLASASIPVTMPPVFFDAVIDGKRYRETHVDGSVVAQAFFTYDLAGSLHKVSRSLGIDTAKLKVNLYIIRNGRVAPQWRKVKNQIASIAEQTIDTFADSQAIGDIYKLYAVAMEKGHGFYLTNIPDDYVSNKKEFFDPKEMRRLFDIGYKAAAEGTAWHNSPPGWENMVMSRDCQNTAAGPV